jgi:hypothetical protein
MKKTNVTISFDEEKLTALRLYMEQKDLQLEDELTKAVESFYGKHVPTNVREFIEMRSGDTSDPTPRARRPKPEKKEQPPIVPGTMNESKGGMAHE